LSFPRRRESRNVLLKKLDARLRGHDGQNSLTAQLFRTIKLEFLFLINPQSKIQNPKSTEEVFNHDEKI
jgi:hypothetical protein